MVPAVYVLLPESVRLPLPDLTKFKSPVNAPLKAVVVSWLTVKVTVPPAAAFVTVPAPASAATAWWLPLRSKVAPASTVKRLATGKRSRPPVPAMAVASSSSSA